MCSGPARARQASCGCPAAGATSIVEGAIRTQAPAPPPARPDADRGAVRLPRPLDPGRSRCLPARVAPASPSSRASAARRCAWPSRKSKVCAALPRAQSSTRSPRVPSRSSPTAWQSALRAAAARRCACPARCEGDRGDRGSDRLAGAAQQVALVTLVAGESRSAGCGLPVAALSHAAFRAKSVHERCALPHAHARGPCAGRAVDRLWTEPARRLLRDRGTRRPRARPRPHRKQAGGPHAEVMALRDAAARHEIVHGATAYVTLEPCAHHGRTPPCCDALIEARLASRGDGPGRPLSAGGGPGRGTGASVLASRSREGLLAKGSRELNIGSSSRVQRGSPGCAWKAAVSLDGRTALENASASGSPARRRAPTVMPSGAAPAVLTGVGTVLDDPTCAWTCAWSTAKQPLRGWSIRAWRRRPRRSCSRRPARC